MDRNAFEHQARTWRKKALQASMSYGAGKEEAEDIAQDVMLRLWQMRDDLDRYARPEALITLMARNLLRNHQRRRQPEVLDETMMISQGNNPHKLLEIKEDDDWLDKRLLQLPATQRTLLYLRQVERYSREEIANLLGIEISSVSTLLSRARRTLLEEIKQRNK